MAISVLKKSKKSLIGWQILDTSFFIASTFTLQSYSAVTTNIINLTRNIVVYNNKLTQFLTILFCCLIVVVGLYFNNRGIIGLCPIIASIQYTICFYITKNEQQMRYALVLNLLMWFMHDIYIQAYPAAINSIALILWTTLQIVRYKGEEKSAELAYGAE